MDKFLYLLQGQYLPSVCFLRKHNETNPLPDNWFSYVEKTKQKNQKKKTHKDIFISINIIKGFLTQ